MDRAAAIALCRERCLKETTVRHLISVEGVMRSLAGSMWAWLCHSHTIFPEVVISTR